MKQNTTKTIDVNCLEWFDKVNGNSYFAGTIIVNYGMPDEFKFHMPFQYGYGSQYEQEAKAELQKRGYLSGLKDADSYYPLSTIARENGIIYRSQIVDKCKKRDLLAISKLVQTSN